MIAYTSATQYAYPQAVTRGSESDANKQVTVSTVYDYNTGMVNRHRRQRARLEHELYADLSGRRRSPSRIVTEAAATRRFLTTMRDFQSPKFYRRRTI